MQIAFVATQVAPFADTPAAQELAALTSQLVSRGHSPRTILPFPHGLDPSLHSLARRLRPLKRNLEGVEYSCVRYDGRLPNGAEVHLLEISGTQFAAGELRTPVEQKLFALFALALLEDVREPTDWCLSTGSAACQVPLMGAAREDGSNRPRHALWLSEPTSDPALEAALRVADQTILSNRTPVYRGNEVTKRILEEALAVGRATVLTPAGVQERIDQNPLPKAAAKSTLQLKLALPVRPEAPLIAFPETKRSPYKEALAWLLCQDAQVVVPRSEADALSELLSRYPDRLAVSDDRADELSAGCDIAVESEDWRTTPTALRLGTLPVGRTDSGYPLVDLAPDLSSGNGMVWNPTGEHLQSAIERALAAYAHPKRFSELSQRLSRTAMTWSLLVDHLLQLAPAAQNTPTTDAE